MKASDECSPCLERLLRQAAELAAVQPGLRAEVIEEGLELLNREFSTDRTSIAVATPLHRLVRSMTGNVDPYSGIKDAEMHTALQVLRDRDKDDGADLRSLLTLAVLGNNIDFFKNIEEIKEAMSGPVDFVIDDTAKLEELLNRGVRSILYLADNAGEVPFDLPLVRLLEGYAPVTYVVKESPVQDDITLADMDKYEMTGELRKIISTGTDTPGVDMDIASAEFRREFRDAGLVLAKGMGYWETLSELPAEGRVFHLLKAKCRPVADSLGVNIDSYVAVLR